MKTVQHKFIVGNCVSVTVKKKITTTVRHTILVNMRTQVFWDACSSLCVSVFISMYLSSLHGLISEHGWV